MSALAAPPADLLDDLPADDAAGESATGASAEPLTEDEALRLANSFHDPAHDGRPVGDWRGGPQERPAPESYAFWLDHPAHPPVRRSLLPPPHDVPNDAEPIDVSTFRVTFTLINAGDLEVVQRGLMPPGEIRKVTMKGIVDTGASRLVLPETVVKQLSLRPVDSRRVRYADGRRSVRTLVDGAKIYLMGETRMVDAISEPGREDALIGALVLETLDFLVDPLKERLIPRDPDAIVLHV